MVYICKGLTIKLRRPHGIHRKGLTIKLTHSDSGFNVMW